MSYLQKKKKIALKNEELVVKAILKYGEDIEGYKVISYTDIARRIKRSAGAVYQAIKRLEEKNKLEQRKSFALFGSMNKTGFKIYL